MKLLYITSSLPIGSQETFIMPEIRALQAAGHQVTVLPVHPRGDFIHNEARPLLHHAVVIPLWSPAMLTAPRYLFTDPRRALRTIRALLSPSPRHLFKNLLALIKAFHVAQRIDLTAFDHIHAHWAAASSSLAMALHLLSEVPWSFTAHRWDIVDNNLLARKIASARFMRLISRSSIELVNMHIAEPPADKMHIIPMGVELPKERPRSTGKKGRTFTLVCPANLLPVKGHRYLLEAMSILKKETVPARLLIAGSGPLEKELKQRQQELGLTDRVEFLGRLSHDKLLALYAERTVDAIVLPSIDLGNGIREGIPAALIEALAFGIPALSTRTGGIPELLEDGAGLMVPDRDPSALAAAIRELSQDVDLCQRLSEAGERTARQRFGVGPVSEQLIALFESTR